MPEPTIIRIQTVNGEKIITGERMGQHLVITQNGSLWSITHLHTGWSIAHFRNKEEAVAVATVLDKSRCEWDWSDPSQIPPATREICHELFTVLSKVIQFAQQK